MIVVCWRLTSIIICLTRSHPIVKKCLETVEEAISLPPYFLRRELSTANVIVDETDCGEVETAVFGFLDNLVCVLDPEESWKPYQVQHGLAKNATAEPISSEDEAGRITCSPS